MNDEFIEIYNDSNASHTVSAISGAGYGIAASDGVVRCTIPNGTVIPARGHWLCVNSTAYNLGTYPSGNGTFATGDGTYTLDIPLNAPHWALQQQFRRGQLHAREPVRRGRLHRRSNLQFLVGIQQMGNFRLYLNIEALP